MTYYSLKAISMKTIQKLFVFTLVLAMFAGCQDELSPLQDYAEGTKQLKVEELEDRVVESVTGSGHVTKGSDLWRTFSLSAQKHESGDIEGVFQINNHGSISVSGIVLCFTVEDNEAWFFTEIVEASDPEYIGHRGYLRVEDNGQGNNVPSDRISLMSVLSPDANPDNYCPHKFEMTMYDIETGNIKVHKVK